MVPLELRGSIYITIRMTKHFIFSLKNLIILPFLIFILQNCAFTKPEIDPQLVTPEMLLLNQKYIYKGFNLLKANATVSIESPNFSNRTYSSIYFKSADSLLIEFHGLFGRDVFKIFFAGQKLIIYDKLNKKVLSGRMDSENLNDLLEFDISYSNYLATIIGIPPLKEEDISNLDAFKLKDNKFLLTFKDSTSIRNYWVNTNKWLVIKTIEEDHAGKILLVCEFMRYSKHKTYYLPQIVRLRKPLQNEQLTLLYSSRKINDLKKTKFDLNISDDVTYHTF